MGSRPSPRVIVVDGVRHLWTLKHEHEVVPATDRGGRCREVFTAYVEGAKRGPVRVLFTGGPGRFAGEPERGVIWSGGALVNLNTPGVAARLIQLARARGWDGARARAPLVLLDGFTLLGLVEAE